MERLEDDSGKLVLGDGGGVIEGLLKGIGRLGRVRHIKLSVAVVVGGSWEVRNDGDLLTNGQSLYRSLPDSLKPDFPHYVTLLGSLSHPTHIGSHQTPMMEYKTHTGSHQSPVIVLTDRLTFLYLDRFSHTPY